MCYVYTYVEYLHTDNFLPVLEAQTAYEYNHNRDSIDDWHYQYSDDPQTRCRG